MKTRATGTELLTYSPLESARFGLRIFRGAFDAVDALELAKLIEREAVDIAILRVPADSLRLASILTMAGLPALVADTLVHYGANIEKLEPKAVGDASLRMTTARPSDMESIARQVFAGYISHYNANPYFDTERIADGYAEWAATQAMPNDEGRAAFLLETRGDVVGFSCTQTTPFSGEMRGVLNGVLPERRGRGVYRDMLRLLLQRCKADRLERFVIATQVHNTAVQRVWMSEGLLLQRAEATIHVNALLTRRHASPHAPAVPDEVPKSPYR